MTTPSITRVGVVAKSHLRAATPHLVDIGAWLANRGRHVVFESATAALMPTDDGRQVASKVEIARTADLVVVLGGDGTLLSMADCVAAAGRSVPILGVNFGSLGFLTEVTLPELHASLEATLLGTAAIDARLMLRSTAERRGRTFASHVALNDVVITKGARSRMIDLSVWVGEEFVTRVKADGLIVATPTGSTAYNLSAGGPIVQPSVDALVLTPIAPHTLTNRPIIIPASSSVRIEPHMDSRDEVFVTFDGQDGFDVEEGDRILVERDTHPLHLIQATTRSYFEVLRQKLKWGER